MSVRRQNIYRELRDELPVLTAEAVYRHFRRTRLNSYDCATLTRVFAQTSTRCVQGGRRSAGAPLAAAGRAHADRDGDGFREQGGRRSGCAGAACRFHPPKRLISARFLRRFAALREEVSVDADSFDYGYYAYGLRHFGNMPLIEPLETREVRKIEDFVIAIDTSMSTSGELVRAFLSRTYELLQENTSFFRHFNLRILQCDDQLRSDKKVTNARELAEYMEHF